MRRGADRKIQASQPPTEGAKKMTVFNFSRLPVSDDRALLRELNHRINNELSSVIDLVSVSAVLADNPEVKTALSNVIELLHGYADVHRALMMPVCNVLVDAAEYLRRLGRAMNRSSLDHQNIRLAFAADTLPLEADRCWRLGLVVHELAAKLARQASIDSQRREIRIELKRSGPLVNCVVSDHESGSADGQPVHSLGIVNDLGKSLGGQIEQGSDAECTSFVLVFPLTEREQRANATLAWRVRRAARRRKSARPSAQRSVAVRLRAATESGPSQLHQR
jgi:two-component sensor histidine kinase